MDRVDQDRSSIKGKRELTATEAADFLGLKRSSLYTYVSRGILRGLRREGHRGRLYPLDELERFARLRDGGDLESRPTVLGSQPSHLGCPVDWGGREPSCGEHPISSLLERSFEQVAELLWTGVLPTEQPSWVARGLGLLPVDLEGALPPGTEPQEGFPLALAALGVRDGDRFASSPAAELYRSRRLLLRLTALLGLSRDLSLCGPALLGGDIAGIFLRALGSHDGPEARALVNRALVLAALQTPGPPEEAVALVASQGADLYSCVAAGLSVLSGPSWAGLCARVDALLAEVARLGRVDAAVQARLRRGEPVPGFGPVRRLPGPRDLRGGWLVDSLRAVPEPLDPPQVLLGLADMMVGSGRGECDLALGLVGVQHCLGLPKGSAMVLLTLGRCAGLIALVIDRRLAGSS